MGTYSDLFKLKPRQKLQNDQVMEHVGGIVSDNEPNNPSSEQAAPVEQNVRLLESQIVRNLTSQNVRLLDFVSSFLDMKNAQLTGFRYPLSLIQQLEKLEYDLKIKSGKRVSKTTIVVTAVAYVLWDYKSNGEKSLLASVIKKNASKV
jgi:hypothetical protein